MSLNECKERIDADDWFSVYIENNTPMYKLFCRFDSIMDFCRICHISLFAWAITHAYIHIDKHYILITEQGETNIIKHVMYVGQ